MSQIQVFLKNINPRKLTREEWLVLIYIVVISGLYLYSHLTFVVSIILVMYFLIIAGTLAHNFERRLTFNVWKVSIAIFILSIIILNLYGDYFFTHEHASANFGYQTALSLNSSYFKSFGLYLATLWIYVFSSISIGDVLLRKWFKQYVKSGIMSDLGYYFFSICLGLSVIATILFLAGIYGVLNTEVFLTVTLLFIVINLRTVVVIIRKLLDVVTKKRNVIITVYSGMFYALCLLFLASILVLLLKGFITGPDGLRAYMNMTHYLAVNHTLPTTAVQVTYPFLTEILFSPAFMIGGIPVALGVMYSISALYITGFYLLAKEITDIQKKPWMLLPIIVAPVFIQMYSTEFKIDIFLVLISSAVFYATYIFIKTHKPKMAYLSMLLMSVAVLVKMTAIYFVIPFYTYVTLSFIRRKNIAQSVIVLMLALLPFAPWFVLYRLSVPRIGTVGLGLSSVAQNYSPMLAAGICSDEIQRYEENLYFERFDQTLKGYVILPLNLIENTGARMKAFSLADIGLVNVMINFILPVVWLFRKVVFKHDMETEKFLILLVVSLVLWIATAPIFTWYALPILMMTSMIIFWKNYDEITKTSRRCVFLATMTVTSVYMVSFILIHGLSSYMPLNLKVSEFIKDYEFVEDYRLVYYRAYKIARLLNKHPESRILFSSSAPFANIYYFIDKFYDRAIFLDRYHIRGDEQMFKGIIDQNNVKYLVLNHATNIEETECLLESYNKADELFEKYGEIIESDDSFSVYTVRLD